VGYQDRARRSWPALPTFKENESMTNYEYQEFDSAAYGSMWFRIKAGQPYWKVYHCEWEYVAVVDDYGNLVEVNH